MIQLNVTQLWALVAGGPVAMVLTVLVGILINNAVGKANFAGVKAEMAGLGSQMDGLRSGLKAEMAGLRSEMAGLRSEMTGLKSDIQRVEGTLTSELKRVEGVLGVKIDALTMRVKSLEDEIHSPLVKR